MNKINQYNCQEDWVKFFPENMYLSGFGCLYFVINNCNIKRSLSETHFCQVVSILDQCRHIDFS